MIEIVIPSDTKTTPYGTKRSGRSVEVKGILFVSAYLFHSEIVSVLVSLRRTTFLLPSLISNKANGSLFIRYLLIRRENGHRKNGPSPRTMALGIPSSIGL